MNIAIVLPYGDAVGDRQGNRCVSMVHRGAIAVLLRPLHESDADTGRRLPDSIGERLVHDVDMHSQPGMQQHDRFAPRIHVAFLHVRRNVMQGTEHARMLLKVRLKGSQADLLHQFLFLAEIALDGCDQGRIAAGEFLIANRFQPGQFIE